MRLHAPYLRCPASAGVIGLARGDQLPRVIASEFRKRDAVCRFEREAILRLSSQHDGGNEDGCRKEHQCRDLLTLHLSNLTFLRAAGRREAPPEVGEFSVGASFEWLHAVLLERMRPDAWRGIYQTKVSTTPSYRPQP